MADLTHRNFPISANSTGKIQPTRLTSPAQGVGMVPQGAYPRLPVDQVVVVQGRGRWDLDEPNVPPTDDRFVRGPSLMGKTGTIDIWLTMPTTGTARTLCYLTDDVATPVNVVAVRIDASNQAVVTIVDSLGATVGAFAGSTALTDAYPYHLRMAWDSTAPVDGVRHASLTINGETAAGTWSTDPTAAWDAFQPTHLVLGQAFGADSDVTDAQTLTLVQASNTVTI